MDSKRLDCQQKLIRRFEPNGVLCHRPASMIYSLELPLIVFGALCID